MKNLPGTNGQLLRFLVVGGCAVAIDAAVYFLLIHTSVLDAAWSKRISFAVGALWAFIANKRFTFQRSGFSLHEPLLFSAVYVVGWLINSSAHDQVYRLRPSPWLAFLIATALSTVANFAGQKWIVFRSKRNLPA